MSHKSTISVKVDNEEALIQALSEMGYGVRTGKHELKAYAWKMDCDLSLTKDGKQLNIGFVKDGDTYKAEADWWGTGISAKQFEEQLNQLHGKHKVSNWLSKKGYKVTLENAEDGSLVVVGTKWN